MKKIYIVIIILLIGIIFLTSQHFTGNSIVNWFSSKKNSQPLDEEIKNIIVTQENLASFLEGINIINELPDNSELELQLYNFDNGEREFEKKYVIKKGVVGEGKAENPDIIILLHSKYVNDLGNFCYTLQKAHRNGDLGLELKTGATQLLWKYRKITKYKECLGL